MKTLLLTAALLLSLEGFARPVAAAEVTPPAVAQQVRTLAENVLGQGLIRGLSVADSGATVLLRWESATYRHGEKAESNREQLLAEAELVTGSIMGRLRSVARVRFSLLRRDGEVLAAGENTRGPGVTLTYTALLGGGIQSSRPAAPPAKKSSGGTDAAKD